MSAPVTFANVKAIVTDIEGTTSSISFVKDVLFPYAADHMQSFIEQNMEDPDVSKQLDSLSQEQGIDRQDTAALIQQLLTWINEDVKATPLKALQGLIWETGYKNGDYKAHMYEDATHQLKAWHGAGIPLYVYSSGSVYAQKLFFGYSEAGNLLPLFDGHFDTNIGHKQETESYKAIQLFLDIPVNELLFLSDIEAELDAAKTAGYQTCHVIRDESIELDTSGHSAVRHFDDIHIQS